MADISSLLGALQQRYKPGQVQRTMSFYFSVEDHKYTLICYPERCEVLPGPSTTKADIVVKCTTLLFEKVFLKREMPGPLDIARGRFRTNDPVGLRKLEQLFRP